ncbi:hypothetical protein SM124_19185 [Bacillus sp. 31A1R]|uniref:Uncharacterized protein n=1 Tax=Robertmurraya mangrovi TaxID=3098077 RepID=A0ABU5J352_9BACI|nr:hypothetical protein [Bacillus sp. 31A1R]MDZ5473847.1 hypothetical protein [Bacillus sp. 31A1R]
MKKNSKEEPTVAPGMNDTEELEKEASSEEVQKGEYTEVTTFSYDEVDPS